MNSSVYSEVGKLSHILQVENDQILTIGHLQIEIDVSVISRKGKVTKFW